MAAAKPTQPKTTAKGLRILVAVPTTGGVAKARTTVSLFRLATALTANGCVPSIINFDGSDVITVRNMYANLVLGSDRWDALLFIDSDMEFDPRLVLRMIALEADVCAAACALRSLDLARYREALNEHGDNSLARAQASRFNVLLSFNTKPETTILQRSGFYSLAAAGMAVCLIRRHALQAMVAEGAVDKRRDVRDGVVTESYGFFDHVKLGDMPLLEDFSFCYRWTETMGRKLWVCADEQVGHVGEFVYGAQYLPVLKQQLGKGAKNTAEPSRSGRKRRAVTKRK